MMRRLAFALSILAAALASSTALRAADDKKDSPLDDTQGQRTDLFNKLDVNHDGQIAADEVPEEQRRLFDRLLRRADHNGDGKLSREEFLSGMNAMDEQNADRTDAEEHSDSGPAANKHRPSDGQRGRAEGRGLGFGGGPGAAGIGGGAGGGPLMGMAVFHALDTNHDGKLDVKEIAAAPEALKKLANSDGEITRDDLMKSMPGVIAGGLGGGGLGGFAPGGAVGGPAGGPGIGAVNPEAMMKQFIQRMDKNGDGKLQKDELPPRMQERFDQLDTNHDGALDESELKTIVPRMMHRLEEKGEKGGSGAAVRPLHRPETDANGSSI
ncbi:MAG TPA: EF-hand domain-containing protein [Pirellulales bacterium]